VWYGKCGVLRYGGSHRLPCRAISASVELLVHMCVCVCVCVLVGRPLVSVHVTGSDTVVRGGQIQLVCNAVGPTSTVGGGVQPRSVLWVKDGRTLSSQVRLQS